MKVIEADLNDFTDMEELKDFYKSIFGEINVQLTLTKEYPNANVVQLRGMCFEQKDLKTLLIGILMDKKEQSLQDYIVSKTITKK